MIETSPFEACISGLIVGIVLGLFLAWPVKPNKEEDDGDFDF